ncbi:DUF937 domain-containing protein [Nonlabens antarcticus]|uniref:DUF937 domain-containing protein n=1 Tax=Nonlabens antarcticus TaxID=392714 RepID=UPI0018916DAF|nr:DUF937 domain-containing protein [Nonlabens antarcticus]
MASILDLLQTDMGQTLINGASQKSNTAPDKTANVLSQAMPLILGAMQRNAKTPEGAASLNNALSDPKHNGGIMDMLGGLFGDGPGSSEELEQDGVGILGHVLGGKQKQVESAISASSGVDMQSVGQIIKIAAPIVMGLIGKQKQQNQVSQGGIGDLLGSVLGQSGSGDSSFLTSILDADGDGSMMDDVAGMMSGGDNKKKGLGGMLGGLFGK